MSSWRPRRHVRGPIRKERIRKGSGPSEGNYDAGSRRRPRKGGDVPGEDGARLTGHLRGGQRAFVSRARGRDHPHQPVPVLDERARGGQERGGCRHDQVREVIRDGAGPPHRERGIQRRGGTRDPLERGIQYGRLSAKSSLPDPAGRLGPPNVFLLLKEFSSGASKSLH